MWFTLNSLMYDIKLCNILKILIISLKNNIKTHWTNKINIKILMLLFKYVTICILINSIKKKSHLIRNKNSNLRSARWLLILKYLIVRLFF